MSDSPGAPALPPDLSALSPWAPELAKTFVSLASDIALVIDDSGVIRNVALGGTQPITPTASHWVGRAWVDTVSGETRPKIQRLLNDVATNGIARRREVNHPLGEQDTVPVAYTAVRLGAAGPVLAVGRDLRAVAAIQQRYVESQQDMERVYWQARQAEARYQLLFQVATDAVAVVDSDTLAIVEANQAAADLLGGSADELQGRALATAFDHHARSAIQELLHNARSSGQSGELRARLQGSHTSASVVATPFRSDDRMRLLVRLRVLEGAGSTSAALTQTISRLVDTARDGVVVTDSGGRVQMANPAFVALVHMPSEAQLKGQPLMHWLQLADQPLAALLAKVRRDGIARGIASWVKPDGAPAQRIDVSAALLTEGDQECIGFTVQAPGTDAVVPGRAQSTVTHIGNGNGSGKGSASTALREALHSGIEALATQLGERNIAVMVQAAATLAEQHFIDLALQRAGGDVPAAAAMLGLTPAALSQRLQLSVAAFQAAGTRAAAHHGASSEDGS